MSIPSDAVFRETMSLDMLRASDARAAELLAEINVHSSIKEPSGHLDRDFPHQLRPAD